MKRARVDTSSTILPPKKRRKITPVSKERMLLLDEEDEDIAELGVAEDSEECVDQGESKLRCQERRRERRRVRRRQRILRKAKRKRAKFRRKRKKRLDAIARQLPKGQTTLLNYKFTGRAPVCRPPKLRRPENSEFIDIYTTTKKYDVVFIDPPVEFRKNVTEADLTSCYFGQAAEHYPTMTIKELEKLPIARILAQNAAVIVFVPPTHILDYKSLYAAWGLKYINFNMVWQKTNLNTPWLCSNTGMGSYTRNVMEYAHIFEKGNLSAFTEAGPEGMSLRYIPGCFAYGNITCVDENVVFHLTRKGRAKMHLLNPDTKQQVSNMAARVPYRVPVVTPDVMEELAQRLKRRLRRDVLASRESQQLLLGPEAEIGVGEGVSAREEQEAYERCVKKKVPIRVFPAVVTGPRTRHSKKPQEIFDRLKRMFSKANNFIELFARDLRPGWDAWGNDPNILHQNKAPLKFDTLTRGK